MKRKWKSLLGLLLTMVLSLTACGSSTVTDEAVLRIDGQEIMRSEYMVYLHTTTQSFIAAAGEDVWDMDFDGQTADELVEERTISTIQSVIAAKEYAEANGIALTAEQQKEAEAAAEQFVSITSAEDMEKIGLDREGIVPLMADSYLYSLVSASIAAECGIDEGDMAAYYQENKDRLREENTMFTLQTILVDELQTAEKAAEQARNGADFAELYAAFDIAPDENQGEFSLYENELETYFGITEGLEKGDIAGPVSVGGKYFVLRIKDKTVPAEAEVKEIAEKTFCNTVEMSYIEARFREMTEAQSVEKIAEAWKTLEKFH